MFHEERPPARSEVGGRIWVAAALGSGLALGAAGGALLFGLRWLGEPAGRTPANLAATSLILLGVLLAGSGLGYYVLAPGFRGPLAAREGIGTHRLVLTSTLFVVLASNLVPMGAALFRRPEGLCTVPGFLSAALSVDFALLGVTYLRFIRPGVLTLDRLGLRRGRLLPDVGFGILVGVAVLVVSASIQAALDRFGVRQTQLLDFRCIRQFPLAGFLAVVLAGGVLAPIAEELFFRGFVFRSYLTTRGPLVAYTLSSVLFASLHFNLPALLPILSLGLMFCWAYHRSGSIVPSMVGHALNNSFAFAILYWTDLR